MKSSLWKKARDRPLDFQRAQPVVARELFRDADGFHPLPIVKGHASLTIYSPQKLRDELGQEASYSDLVRAVSARPWSLPREFVESEPLSAVKQFFDHIGGLWENFLSPDGNQALRTPAGLVVAVTSALRAGAIAADIPSHHPIYPTLIALEIGAALQASSSPTKLAASKLRAYAVSLVEQGYEAVRVTGDALSKDEVREIVLIPLAAHCGRLLPRGGIKSVEGLP